MIPHGSNKTRAEFFARQDLEPDPNPDGYYWDLGRQALQAQLTDLIGKEAYTEWAELVWPGATIDSLTWRQIYEQLNRALDEAWQGQRDTMKLADAAEYLEGTAPGCYGLPD